MEEDFTCCLVPTGLELLAVGLFLTTVFSSVISLFPSNTKI